MLINLGNLFSSSSSHERKSWGFKLFTKLVTTAPRWTTPHLFSPNFTRSLINQSKDGDRFLHAAALAALKAIKSRAQSDPTSAALLFIAMTAKNGVIDFDKLTKTKTLEQIVISADDDALDSIVEHLHSLILRPGSDEAATVDLRRRLIADMLLHIVKCYSRYDSSSSALKQANSWLHKLLDTFVESCYFVPTSAAKTRKIPLPPISEPSRKMFQERLSSCLGRLLTVSKQTGVSFPYLVVSMISSRTKKGKYWESTFKAEKSVLKTVEKAYQSLDALSTEVRSRSLNNPPIANS
jgi:DNA polymerase phi